MAAVGERKDTREMILEGCRIALGRHGYRKMTMDDVAEAAGLVKRTLYLHFSSKDELVRLTITEALQRTLEAMELAFRHANTGREALRGVLLARIEHRLQEFASFSRTLDDVNRMMNPDRSDDRWVSFGNELKLIVAVLKAGQIDGTLSVEDPNRTASVLLKATNAYLPSTLSREDAANLPETVARLHHLVDLLVAALSTRRKL